MQIKKLKNYLKISLDSKIYPLEAIYGACYVFIDRAYLFLDGDPQGKIQVFIKRKDNSGGRKIDQLAGEFKNELLNYILRNKVAKSNKKIREYIISQALLSPVYPFEENLQEEDYLEDPLGISQTWEEKFQDKKTKSKKKTRKKK